MFKPSVRNTAKGVVIAAFLVREAKRSAEVYGQIISSDANFCKQLLASSFGGFMTGASEGFAATCALDQVDIVLDAFQNL